MYIFSCGIKKYFHEKTTNKHESNRIGTNQTGLAQIKLPAPHGEMAITV
jgi:hypothetical protein